MQSYRDSIRLLELFYPVLEAGLQLRETLNYTIAHLGFSDFHTLLTLGDASLHCTRRNLSYLKTLLHRNSMYNRSLRTG